MKKEMVRRPEEGRINISISLPPQMGELIDRAAGDQLQNRSEFVREAVREKLGSLREPIVLTKEEEREREQAMKDYKAGKNIINLKNLRAQMDSSSTHKKSAKSVRTGKRKR